MQNRNSKSDVREELLPDAVHPNAYNGSTGSVRGSSDALYELDKLGLPRTSSLGESMNKLDHEESTDDDGAYHASPSPYRDDTAEESSSLDEAGIFYEMPPGFSTALQGRGCATNSREPCSDINPQNYYFCVKNSTPNSPLSSSSGTLSLSGELNNLAASYPDVVYPDQLYDDLNVGGVHGSSSYIADTIARGNGSSGESGCDTEGTVKAQSDDDDYSVDEEQNSLKIEANRELLESGFTEDFHPSVSSVYEEEAVINIEQNGYNDSDSDDGQSVQSEQRSYNDRGSCVSFSTGYPESFYRQGEVSESCYSSDVTCRSHDKNVKKSKLVRRPHVKASQSPLLERRKNNPSASNKSATEQWKENSIQSKKCMSRPGDMEIELERPSKEITDDEHDMDEETDIEQGGEETCQEVIPDERENTSPFNLFRGVKSILYRGELNSSNKSLHSPVLETEVEDSDAEYCRIMEKTMQLEISKTKWAKTKEQVLRLLKERLQVLKKVIQDKNTQIRQLKSRLKMEQQNSQAMAEKLKVIKLKPIKKGILFRM